jgi:hypothetical protein
VGHGRVHREPAGSGRSRVNEATVLDTCASDALAEVPGVRRSRLRGELVRLADSRFPWPPVIPGAVESLRRRAPPAGWPSSSPKAVANADYPSRHPRRWAPAFASASGNVRPRWDGAGTSTTRSAYGAAGCGTAETPNAHHLQSGPSTGATMRISAGKRRLTRELMANQAQLAGLTGSVTFRSPANG